MKKELVEIAFMREALREAERALQQGEVPVGAVIVRGGEILGRGRNQVESTSDGTAHAEMLALRATTASTGDRRLCDADMYVTLEPCTMCAGALVLARIRRLYFGAVDPKAGGVVSLYRIASDDRLNHRIEIHRGILEEECEDLLKRFFSTKR